MSEADRQAQILLRGAEKVFTEDDLRRKLASGRPLRVKLGVDPSAPDIHLGHTVVLRKLRQFQDLGHQAIFLIGDFTGLIGDPTGRNKTRPPLTPEEVEKNAKTYLDQVGGVLDVNRLEVRRNSEWLSRITLPEFYRLAAAGTAAKFLQREDFSRRIEQGVPIFLHELFYPLLQAYDSVALKADVELGGVDQTLNILVGRDLQRELGQEAQVGLVVPILRGIGGGEKMSKSLGNAVGIHEPASEMFAKLMSIPDEIMDEYYTLLTLVPLDEVRGLHPKERKKRLAREITAQFHAAAAEAAQTDWETKFESRETPEDIPDLKTPASVWVVQLVAQTGVVKSNGEARRLVEQGGVELDGTKVTDPKANLDLKSGQVLRVGKKKRFFRIVVS